jgi:anti-sigma factor RsiW
MLFSQASEELQELLSELVDGQLDEDGLLRLDEILWTFPELQTLYNRFVTLHGMLHWSASPPLESALPPIGPMPAVDLPRHAAVFHSSPPLGFPGGAWHGAAGYFARHELLLSYLIAMVVFAVGLLVGLTTQVSHQHETQTAETGGRRRLRRRTKSSSLESPAWSAAAGPIATRLRPPTRFSWAAA